MLMMEKRLHCDYLIFLRGLTASEGVVFLSRYQCQKESMPKEGLTSRKPEAENWAQSLPMPLRASPRCQPSCAGFSWADTRPPSFQCLSSTTRDRFGTVRMFGWSRAETWWSKGLTSSQVSFSSPPSHIIVWLYVCRAAFDFVICVVFRSLLCIVSQSAHLSLKFSDRYIDLTLEITSSLRALILKLWSMYAIPFV